jgi:hypothetical protein
MSTYTLTKLDVPIIPNPPRKKCEVLVATGYLSVPYTMSYRAKRKYYYVRGFENWQAPDAKIIAAFRSGLQCITNCRWLHEFLISVKVQNRLVPQGLDFHLYRHVDIARTDVVGGVFHPRDFKRHIDVIAASETAGYPCSLLGRSFTTDNYNGLNCYYNGLKVWMSPSENEGLQNCPMEAALCGCALLFTDHPHAGCSDYAITEETCLMYPARDTDAAASQIKRLMTDEVLRQKLNRNAVAVLREKIGTKEEAAKRFLEAIQ